VAFLIPSAPQQTDPITALRDPTTHQPHRGHRLNPITSQEQLNAHADAFYSAPGGLYNLNLVTNAGAQATLLEALTREGKTLPRNAGPGLSLDQKLDPFHISRTIRGMMPNRATSGLDEFPSKFFKVFAGVDSKAVDETTGSESPAPNPLAALLGQQAFHEMLAAGSMSPNMRTGIISILFEDNGRRDDLRNYRPITVLCSLYKILSRAMALQLGTVLLHLVDSVHAALKPDKRTNDITHLVQDLIDYCEEHVISGILAFCDHENHTTGGSIGRTS
jgi:hypothetical protein